VWAGADTGRGRISCASSLFPRLLSRLCEAETAAGRPYSDRVMLRRLLLISMLCSLRALAQDVESGKDVFGPCAGCHGRYGEGGKGGEYPRLAGQPAAYLVEQLVAFQERKRKNLPMFPYTEPRELSQRDMKDVAAYLNQLELLTRAPDFKPSDGALERLKAMERVIVVPRVPGDTEHGQALYAKRCGSCHGRTGKGRRKATRGWSANTRATSSGSSTPSSRASALTRTTKWAAFSTS